MLMINSTGKSYVWIEARGGEIAKTVPLIERGPDHGLPGELVSVSSPR
jgi:hypothetical protein